MSERKLVTYYLTEDVLNEKEKGELDYLQKIGRVVIVTVGRKANIPGVKQITLNPLSNRLYALIVIWSKICFVMCRLANSRTDIDFPKRNIYTGSRLLRTLVNVFWRIKVVDRANRFFPRYDTLFFFPFITVARITGKRYKKRKLCRVVVHDSLALRLINFAYFIAGVRCSGIKTIANVKSWDNPFYSQQCSGADGYIVWSESMWRDLQKAHNLNKNFVEVWGARPFLPFYLACRDFGRAPEQKIKRNGLVIGYAAAFSESVMGTHEIQFVKNLANRMCELLPGGKIHFRPYPILSRAFYKSLEAHDNVEIIDIEGEEEDRYGDGRERIKFGSNHERIHYLSRCDCFLSLATSFTIEAAIYGLPIFHYRINPEKTCTEDEYKIHQRIVVSDHIVRYFEASFMLSESIDELIHSIASLDELNPVLIERNRSFLKMFGIPQLDEGWSKPSSSVLKFAAEA